MLRPGPDGGLRMYRRLTYKEARRQLEITAVWLVPTVRVSLELWLQVVEELPSHLQPCTEDASDLVQAALQQAPPATQADNVRQLAWMHSHLPRISTALQHSVSSQLEICCKRVSILQSLSKSGKLPDSTHVGVENSTRMLIDAMSIICSNVLPVSELCLALKQASSSNACIQHERGHQQQRLQQGKELVRGLGGSLACCWRIHTATKHQVHQLSAALRELGTQEASALSVYIDNAEKPAALASLVWLGLVSWVASVKEETVCFLIHVKWSLLLRVALPRPAYVWGRDLLSYVLACPEAKGELQGMLIPEALQGLLRVFGVTADVLQGYGMSASQVQQLLPSLQGASSSNEPGAHGSDMASMQVDGNMPAARSEPTTSSSRRVGGDSGELADEEAEATGVGDGFNDMQTLLQMMYGCSV